MTLTDVALVNGGPDFSVALEHDLRALAPMRREAARRLLEASVDVSVIDDAVLILSELCTNAIEFAAPGSDQILALVRFGDDSVTIEVHNTGPPFDRDAARSRTTAPRGTDRGRGLIIVRALAEKLTLRHRDGKSVVTAVVALD